MVQEIKGVFKSEFFTLLKSCWVSASVECKTITQKVRLNSLVGGMYGNRVGAGIRYCCENICEQIFERNPLQVCKHSRST